MPPLLQVPKKFRQIDSSYDSSFQAFLDEREQACRGVHDKEFEPTEASEISRIPDKDILDASVSFRQQTTVTNLRIWT